MKKNIFNDFNIEDFIEIKFIEFFKNYYLNKKIIIADLEFELLDIFIKEKISFKELQNFSDDNDSVFFKFITPYCF